MSLARAHAHPVLLTLALAFGGVAAAAEPLSPDAAERVRDVALAAAPDAVSAEVTVTCADPAARCGYETVQPNFASLAELLSQLDHACADAPEQCRVLLDRLDTDSGGDTRARIRLLPPGELATHPRAAPRATTVAATEAVRPVSP